MQYILEIYWPGSTDTVLDQIKSDRPFMTIGRGDLIEPGFWEDWKRPDRILRVVGVEHIIWRDQATGDPCHQIMVYTEEVDDTLAATFGRPG